MMYQQHYGFVFIGNGFFCKGNIFKFVHHPFNEMFPSDPFGSLDVFFGLGGVIYE